MGAALPQAWSPRLNSPPPHPPPPPPLSKFALDEHEPVALTVHHFPVCVTMTFLNEGQRILVDATRKEELVGDGRLTVALNNHREVCLLHKSGALALTPDQVQLRIDWQNRCEFG